MLWSAVVASCALPFTYSTCPIYTKDPDTGEIQPDLDGVTYTDGSVQSDIPFDAIRGQFDVNHAVVAQVNPHVVMFLEDRAAAERRWKPAYAMFLDMIRETTVGWLGSSRLGSIIGQQYSGHITVLPRDWLCDVRNVLRNPTPQFMEDSRRKGERAVWERMSIIENHMRIEKALAVAMGAISDAIRKGL
jgi:TAG lipase / steryl ester hydrolase / phospholipase A2 / LPA acyltransferase